MKIKIDKADFRAAEINWNTLTNSKHKNKNYFIPTTIEEHKEFERATRFRINFREWILLENAITAFNELICRIYKGAELKSVVSYTTFDKALRRELEIEISAREKEPKDKRNFVTALESIENFIDGEVSLFDYFFPVEGLKLESLEKISCGKVEIFVFNQELQEQLIAAHFDSVDSQNPEALERVQGFFDDNFLNRLCVKSTVYGDSYIARKKAYRQARELINYFRYILCLFTHERVSEQMVKVSFTFESYSNSEKTLIRRDKDNTVSLSFSRGRKPIQTFPIDKECLENLSFNGFLDDFTAIINAPSQTQLEGCILTAIYWIGEAQNESDLDVSFLKYWTALECIFTGVKKDTLYIDCDKSNSDEEGITHNLAKGISRLNAFSNYSFIKAEDIDEISKKVKKLYDKRSDIIHRGMNYLADQVVGEDDISTICKYTAWSILSLFHLRSDGCQTMEDVGEQINTLYTQWQNSSFSLKNT